MNTTTTKNAENKSKENDAVRVEARSSGIRIVQKTVQPYKTIELTYAQFAEMLGLVAGLCDEITGNAGHPWASAINPKNQSEKGFRQNSRITEITPQKPVNSAPTSDITL